MSILEDSWYGNIEPSEYDTSSAKEYKRSTPAYQPKRRKPTEYAHGLVEKTVLTGPGQCS